MFPDQKGGGQSERAEQQACAQKQRLCVSRDKHQSLLALIDSAVKAVFAGTLSVTAVMMI